MDPILYSRMDRQRRRFPAALGMVAFWSAMFTPTATAAESLTEPGSGADAADQPAYRKAIKAGLAEYDALHFDEARSLFRRAHAISPSARTFRGIGMASFELRDYVSAVRSLSAALRDQRRPLSAEQRRQTQDLLDRAHTFVDICTLTVSPHNARVIVDGHAPEFEPDGTLLFGFGVHTVEVSARGMEIRSLSINVRGGERRELSVVLASASSSAGARSADASVSRPWSAGRSNGLAVASLWASGGAALLAGGSGIYWYMQNSQLNSCHNPAGSLRCTNESALKTQRNIALGLTVGAGAAALAMAIISIFSWNSSAPAVGHSAMGCTVGPSSVTCARSF